MDLPRREENVSYLIVDTLSIHAFSIYFDTVPKDKINMSCKVKDMNIDRFYIERDI